MEARIHIEQPSPPHCAACHQAKPHKRHVDFGASFDGPMLPALEGTVGVVGHSIDEVIICEDCIADAGRLVGLEAAEDLREQLDKANEVNDALHEQLAAQRHSVTDALDNLKRHVTGETTLPQLPNSILPIAPVPPGRGDTGRKRRAKKAAV